MSDNILFSATAGEIKSEPVNDNVFDSIKIEEPESAPGNDSTKTFLDAATELPDPKNKRPSKLQTQLEGTYVSLGTAIFMFDQQTGGTIVQQAPDCAAALNELAKTNPNVKRALENMMATSAWGAVIAAHLPIVVLVATKYVPPLKEKLIGDVAAAAANEEPVEGYQEFAG